MCSAHLTLIATYFPPRPAPGVAIGVLGLCAHADLGLGLVKRVCPLDHEVRTGPCAAGLEGVVTGARLVQLCAQGTIIQ